MRSRTFLAMLVAGAAAACGGSGTGYPTMNPSSGQGGVPPAGGAAAAVTIQDFAFSPATVTVKVGGTVQWTNAGGVAHTTTADNGAWDSAALAAAKSGMAGGTGGTFSRTFTTAGTFTYHCQIHPFMTGRVTVTQ